MINSNKCWCLVQTKWVLKSLVTPMWTRQLCIHLFYPIYILNSPGPNLHTYTLHKVMYPWWDDLRHTNYIYFRPHLYFRKFQAPSSECNTSQNTGKRQPETSCPVLFMTLYHDTLQSCQQTNLGKKTSYNCVAEDKSFTSVRVIDEHVTWNRLLDQKRPTSECPRLKCF